MDVEKFQDDVYAISELLSERLDKDDVPKLNFVRQRLIEMYKENLVKINHSVLELICASELITYGYFVDVEKPVSKVLRCDLYGTKGTIIGPDPNMFGGPIKVSLSEGGKWKEYSTATRLANQDGYCSTIPPK